MPTEELESRLAAIEARLGRIESKLVLPKLKTRAIAPESVEATAATPSRPAANASVTSILGWGGATALVLAAVYLVRLAIDSGWLTPERQIGMAVVGALALIGAGLALRHANRGYAALLPAGGIVTLFIAIYGAHMYYGLISPFQAAAGVVLVCVLSLWLCQAFASELFALFAVAGSYSAPFLIDNVLVDVTDLAIYFSAWSLLFSLYAIRTGQRLVYLLALYCALLGFDALHRTSMQSEWLAALLFQSVQFVIFAVTATLFSIRRQQPMSREVAVAHLPALLIFYFLQYALLDQHLHDWAPWIALLTVGVLAGLYLLARFGLHGPMPGGHFLLSAYAALVLFHAGYIELVPQAWAPWVAFALAPAVAWFAISQSSRHSVGWPMGLAVVGIFALNYVRVLSGVGLEEVPGEKMLAVLYALECYAGYAMLKHRGSQQTLLVPLLYAGHISAMAGAAQIFDSRLTTSVAWGMLAIGCLLLAIRGRERLLGQSSLLIFAVSSAKVMLYDLHLAPPLMRVGILLALGLSLYAGGWLYQRMLTAR